MNDAELEALARQLWAIHDEACPDGSVITWEDLNRCQREAWIQVAEFVSARDDDIEEAAKYGTLRGARDAVTKLLNESEWPDHR